MKDQVRIGLWAAFWGDTNRAARQLLEVPELDYLVADYLAEITMALLARARMKDADAGYVPDAVEVIAGILPDVQRRGIKVITNAGALNPQACAAAIRALAPELKVAAVGGDDLLPRLDELKDHRDMFTGQPLLSSVTSLNAYLGARPIAAALDAGADIVVTGRCADAATVLGPLIHEFGWSDADHDLLAAGSLVGHIIECGPQCTGGLHTDWDQVPGWDDMGYPIAEVSADGSALITKPPGTGGLVTPATIGEQVLYEIGDPGAYVMPDVVCDWRDITLTQEGEDRVRVSGARGSAPTTTYKVTATATDGYRAVANFMTAGVDAPGRARRAAEALVARTERLIAQDGFAPLLEASIEVAGSGDLMGARDDHGLEAVAKVGVRHAEREALEVFARELAPLALVAQGLTGFFSGRPRPAPVFRVFHLLVEKAGTPVTVTLGGETFAVEIAPGSADAVTATEPLKDIAQRVEGETVTVALKAIAYARSGDKGDKANIGLIARRPEYLSVIRAQVSPARVADYFAHYLSGDVKRWALPGFDAVNYLLDAVLGGTGGTSSLRFDPQGKSYAAMLLALPVQVPVEWGLRPA